MTAPALFDPVATPVRAGAGRPVVTAPPRARRPAWPLRQRSITELLPASGRVALHVGSCDAELVPLLVAHFKHVVIADRVRPRVEHERVTCVSCDPAHLVFPDAAFDVVLCTGLLERVAPEQLAHVAGELQRVAGAQLLVEVAYREDLRLGRRTCPGCGCINPPQGHLNHFDEQRLSALFGASRLQQVRLLGEDVRRTNALATWLRDRAGNPDPGEAAADEPCLYCGRGLGLPPAPGPLQRALKRLAGWSEAAQRALGFGEHPQPGWVHILMTPASSPAAQAPTDRPRVAWHDRVCDSRP